MTHCVEFWHKWRKEPNFCGLSPQAISEIKGYLELVEKIKKTGLTEDLIFDKCPSGACRPILRLSDDDTRTKALNYIVSCLKRGEKVTGSDLQNSIKVWLGTDKCEVPKEPQIGQDTTQMRTATVEEKGLDLPTTVSSGKGLNEQEKHVLAESMERHHDALVKLSDPPRPKPAPCLSGLPCPDGKDHCVAKKCVLWDRYLNQIPFNECYLNAKARRESKLGFTTALDLAKPLAVNPLVIKPVEVSKSQAEEWITAIVRGYFTPKDKNICDMLVGTGELGDTYLEMFQALLIEAAERMCSA